MLVAWRAENGPVNPPAEPLMLPLIRLIAPRRSAELAPVGART
jgi:hypothetical protein